MINFRILLLNSAHTQRTQENKRRLHLLSPVPKRRTGTPLIAQLLYSRRDYAYTWSWIRRSFIGKRKNKAAVRPIVRYFEYLLCQNFRGFKEMFLRFTEFRIFIQLHKAMESCLMLCRFMGDL